MFFHNFLFHKQKFKHIIMQNLNIASMQSYTKCPCICDLYLYLNLIPCLWWWPMVEVREVHRHGASMFLAWNIFSLEVYQTSALPLKMLCFSLMKTQRTSLKNYVVSIWVTGNIWNKFFRLHCTLNCDISAFHHTSSFNEQLYLSSEICLGLELIDVYDWLSAMSSTGNIFTK